MYALAKDLLVVMIETNTDRVASNKLFRFYATVSDSRLKLLNAPAFNKNPDQELVEAGIHSPKYTYCNVPHHDGEPIWQQERRNHITLDVPISQIHTYFKNLCLRNLHLNLNKKSDVLARGHEQEERQSKSQHAGSIGTYHRYNGVLIESVILTLTSNAS
jgi:hypothetical protein